MKFLALTLIGAYKKVLSPFLGNHCRYFPTCSSYVDEAIRKYGFLKGSFLGGKRLLRCHPFHAGGIDPVP